MDKYHQRLKALFADIESLAEMPDIDLPAMRRELQSLRARVIEMEMRFLESQKNPAPETASAPQPPSRPKAPLLYEKEQVGYAYTGDKLEPLQITTLAGLDVQRALLAPLTETEQTVGAVMVEPPHGLQWNQEDAALAEAVARQVSLQVQNLRLLAEAERARSEAQAATRRFTHESWQNYLDAINHEERIGYSYDQNAVLPYHEPLPITTDFQAEVKVLEEQIGRIALKTSPAQPLDETDKTLVQSVAALISRQVENLRLLADASRARAEAEEATRRITREGWQQYAEAREDSTLAFEYDGLKVSPVQPKDSAAPALSGALTVRGETIGHLAVDGLENASPETQDLLNAIATQASLHLETLRLNEELQQRAQELQELDRLKSAFLANMSHELRTPLNSILGFSDVILEGIDGSLTEYMENDVKLIQKNGQHLLHLINDVLDMAKIESGRMNLHPETFNLQNVFDDVIGLTSSLANEKSLTLLVEPDSDASLEIYADTIRMRQVMINLVNNAIKFTERGQISLRVDRQDGDKILIRVRDTGLGIPADHLEAIFQEFSQVDSSTTRKAGGTGLGLPISRRLVEMHGGRMWAESSGIAGEGSAFYVEMPLKAVIPDVEKTVK